MPKTNLRLYWSALFVSLLALGGCAKDNASAPALTESGQHPANWVVAHRAAYQASPSSCGQCHGGPGFDTSPAVSGGIAQVSCFSTSFGALTCHAGGHAPRLAPHPVPFTDPAQHGPLAKQDLTFCQTCHAAQTGPGTNPRFNLPIGSLTTGCEGSGCHLPNMAHPTPWQQGAVANTKGHASAGNLANACTLCHGVALAGGVGPACSSCHTSLTAGAVPVLGACVSCHSAPPSGSSFPNVAGAHLAHNALAEVANVCSTCHNGGGSGTASHGSGTVTLAVLATYNANGGTATYIPASGTCASVSCHGGIQTPNWQSGQIDVATQCTSCHTAGTSQGVPQNNSYFSGLHDFHLSPQQVGLLCTDCHDAAILTAPTTPGHFSGLKTAAFELAPSATIRSVVNYNAVQHTCSPQNNGTNFSFTACHATRTWQ
ncbi:CxxxxCH/CxxCH domain-containing protein [Geomonas sp. Red32]|uniref:CxxxxCH/CxxCH domain c-type cytochrome n=1 Tax=Geomonas sp. Red32 TaxID=2912856 RepID=UPI00202CCECC|nr:CxxxxCH/CxxCH domain-containing protein [Geomonas sp. Red32]MCM0080732.1 CxxxxCH/CxxCH domain-containing protein [Geomonas sp. Red32]